jgi:hypothetical protein
MTDGVRWAVVDPQRLEDEDASVRVVDTRGNASFWVDRPDPACWTSAVGAGRLLWTCPEPDLTNYRPVVTNLTTRRTAEPRGLAALRRRYPQGVDFAPRRIGRRWVEIDMAGVDWRDRAFLNRKTGRLVVGGPASRQQHVNLDREALVERLCSPLRRRRLPGSDPVVSSSYALFEDQDAPVVLRGCGRRAPRRVVNCVQDYCSPQLGAGYLTWTSEDGVRAYLPARRRLLKLGLLRGLLPVAVQHTRNSVFATSDEGRTYVRRLPVTGTGRRHAGGARRRLPGRPPR